MTESVQPIKQDGTRLAQSVGEMIVLDPPVQDIPRLKQDTKIRILEGNENRTIFFGFDQWRDELQYSSVKGKNPFKDKRVREAFQLAIDLAAIRSQVMRGLAFPTNVMFAPQVDGYDKGLDTVKKVDRARAKKLLAEAGYPNGFDITLDCPNNRYINDEKICQATAAMLAQIDVKVRLNSMPRATYFPKIQKFDTSFYMLGWGVPTFDSLYAVQSLLPRVEKTADGYYNLGRTPTQRSTPRSTSTRRDRTKKRAARAARERPSQADGAIPAAQPGDSLGDRFQRDRGHGRTTAHHDVGQDPVTRRRGLGRPAALFLGAIAANARPEVREPAGPQTVDPHAANMLGARASPSRATTGVPGQAGSPRRGAESW